MAQARQPSALGINEGGEKMKKTKSKRKWREEGAWQMDGVMFTNAGVERVKGLKISVKCKTCSEIWDVELSPKQSVSKTALLCPNKCNLEKLGLDASGENTDNEIAEGQE
jgi:hypothetical protein